MSEEEWVHKLNSLSAEMDAICAVLHPSAWHLDPDLQKKMAEFRKLAKTETTG